MASEWITCSAAGRGNAEELRKGGLQPCLRDSWRGNAVSPRLPRTCENAPGRNSMDSKALNAVYTFGIGATFGGLARK